MIQDTTFVLALYHILLHIHIVEGILVCPVTHQQFVIQNEIPNLIEVHNNDNGTDWYCSNFSHTYIFNDRFFFPTRNRWYFLFGPPNRPTTHATGEHHVVGRTYDWIKHTTSTTGTQCNVLRLLYYRSTCSCNKHIYKYQEHWYCITNDTMTNTPVIYLSYVWLCKIYIIRVCMYYIVMRDTAVLHGGSSRRRMTDSRCHIVTPSLLSIPW